jgi:hypothetical protein
MKNLTYLFLLLIVACNSIDYPSIKNKKPINQSEKIVSITDDQFILDAIENDEVINNIEASCRGFNKDIETVINSYNNTLDTIAVYYEDTDTVSIYSAVDNKFVLKMNINTNKIAIFNNLIRIGMDSRFFIKKYPEVKSVEIFEICNTEGFICLQFTIKNYKLCNIKYKSCYND